MRIECVIEGPFDVVTVRECFLARGTHPAPFPLAGSSMHSRWRTMDNGGKTADDRQAKPGF
jgi:hypothetical protein